MLINEVQNSGEPLLINEVRRAQILQISGLIECAKIDLLDYFIHHFLKFSNTTIF
ncbi:unnamed protein product, partial [Vitis vinifera]|uniref:Uncharacterized protein n=1 Tax=Vitis vinifera TaxID=29760 RepID=D7UAM7_VITVI